MAETTWNTEHVNFRIRKDNLPSAVQALVQYAAEKGLEVSETPRHIYDVLALVDLQAHISAATGDLVNVYLADGYWNDLKRGALAALSPFVEPGSYVAFFGGGADGCWGLTWNKEDDEVRMRFENFEAVAEDDLRRLLQAAEEGDPELFAEMTQRYGYLFEEEING